VNSIASVCVYPSARTPDPPQATGPISRRSLGRLLARVSLPTLDAELAAWMPRRASLCERVQLHAVDDDHLLHDRYVDSLRNVVVEEVDQAGRPLAKVDVRSEETSGRS
jgi:hypothetical protein